MNDHPHSLRPVLVTLLLPIIIYAGATLLILWPALPPGYLLMMDMIAVPHPALGSPSDSTFLLSVWDLMLAHVLPADAAQKLTIGGVFWLTGFGAHLLARRYLVHPLAPYSAGLLYLFNPAIYGRFFYGQWLVILGWGMLPWILIALRSVIRTPYRSIALGLGVMTGIIISWAPHTLFYLLLLGVVLTATTTLSAQQRQRVYALARQRSLWGATLIAILTALVIVLPWLLPTLGLHSGLSGYLSAQTPRVVARETAAFATFGDPVWGTLGNVLAGYGFWAESTERFVSAKTLLPEWPLFIMLLPVLSVIGLVRRWHSGDRILAPALAFATLVAVFLAIGISSPFTAPLSRVLFTHVPLYSGLRDTQKWTGVVLLGYAYLVSGATDALLIGATTRYRSALPAAIALCLLLPLLPGTAIFFGGQGQLHPATYPGSWSSANRLLIREMPRGSAVFLPWHLYLWLPFAGHVVANPAPLYFARPIVSSGDEELGLAQAGYSVATPQQKAATTLLLAKHPAISHLAEHLARDGICGIIVALSLDWEHYFFLKRVPHLRTALRSETLLLLINDDARCH